MKKAFLSKRALECLLKTSAVRVDSDTLNTNGPISLILKNDAKDWIDELSRLKAPFESVRTKSKKETRSGQVRLAMAEAENKVLEERIAGLGAGHSTTLNLDAEELEFLSENGTVEVDGVTVEFSQPAFNCICSWRAAAERGSAPVAEPTPQSDEDLARTIAQAAKELSERGYESIGIIRPTPFSPNHKVTLFKEVSSDD